MRHPRGPSKEGPPTRAEDGSRVRLWRTFAPWLDAMRRRLT